jgi:hypothetical protein
LAATGIWAYLLGLALIAIGLIPYRKLSQLELFPNVLEVHPESLVFMKRGKEPLVIPRDEISTLSFFESKSRYGILLTMRSPSRNITLQYFNRRSFERLQTALSFEF